MNPAGIARRGAAALRYASIALAALAPDAPGRPVALVRMVDPRATRRLDQICAMLRTAGCAVRIDADFRAYAGMNEYGRRLFAAKGIRKNAVRGKRDLLVTDSPDPDSSGNKTIAVFYADGTAEADMFVPIMFHPDILNVESYRQADGLAGNADRTIRILFAGNVSEKTYSRPIRTCGAELLNRHCIVSALRKNGLGGGLVEPESYEEFAENARLGNYRRSFVLVDTAKFSIPSSEWLRILSRTEYFLAPPGFSQPFCHNIAEAMAAGAVPVTQYGNCFSPALEDGKESRRFDSEEQLIAVLTEILRGGESAAALGGNAKRYHDERLGLPAAAERIRAFMEDPAAKELRIALARPSSAGGVR